jgi:RNA polymerase sigma factor (sigma-70 family)
MRTGSLDEAKDILQETYARVLAVQRADAIQSLDHYVWRSALNIMSDCRRSSKNRERLVQALSARPEQFAPSTEAVAETREQLALVSEAVHELPLRYQEAFLLRIVRCLPFEAVGHEMRVSSRMAKIYVSRTLGHLRRRLDQPDPPRRSIERIAAPAPFRVRIPSTSGRSSARSTRARLRREAGVQQE